MRPPDHWHLRRKRATPPWWLFALGGVVVLGALLWRCQLSDGGGALDRVAAGPCAAATCEPEGPPASFGGGAPPSPKINGRSAAVLEEPCGALLYGLAANLRRPPASLTKLATALVATERADLDETVEVRVNSALLVASTGSTVMGLEPGMRLSMRDLLHGLLLTSGNDAAIAIAEAVAGNVPAFVDLMNEKAVALGLRNTHFANPHGLDDPALYSSALDMALLGHALLVHPELAAIVRTKEYQPAWDGPELWNGNALLDLYPEAIGIKIGYTETAGQTIVAAAERNGRRLVVSVLGSRDRYADAMALLEWGFAEAPPGC
ncbi:MAG: D-alanyl-D-alanine carboxypeptidase [Chloroflexi bacterium]|nr:D-alanyl-D-alanine carboxypeptidase [Chloroflexota bacterium]